MDKPRPTRAELLAAAGGFVPDLIAPNLIVLFCGINPGLYSAAIGHHFGRPGNRFWGALHLGGFTDRLLTPHEEHELLARGYGITNMVARASARADELSTAELLEGRSILMDKVERHRPRVLAVLGLGAYRTGFQQADAAVGLQAGRIGDTVVWVLPNPSGLNAHYKLEELGAQFAQLRAHSEQLQQ